MVEALIRDLIESYNNDLRDYRDLRFKMQEFNGLLEQNHNNKKGEKSPIEEIDTRSDEAFEKSLLEFCAYRERVFANLKRRADQANNLQIEACSKVGVDSFEIGRFQLYLNKNLYEELRLVVADLGENIADILVMDKDILGKLNANLEKIRLDIHRIAGFKKTRSAYDNTGYADARFIDRTK